MKSFMKLFINISLIALAVISICSCSKKGGGDIVKPTVASTIPASDATGVEVSDPIYIVFSEEMNPVTITNARFVLEANSETVSTSVSYDDSTRTATMHHASSLENSTNYVVTISKQVTDTSGNSMEEDYSFSFTTADVLFGSLSWENPLPQGNTLNGVWSFSESDIFAVGNVGMIVRSDGATWSVMESNTNVDLGAVWGTSAENVYAVGGSGAILHYDGTTWSLSYTESEGATLYSIWGSSASDIFVGSDNGILHWNGSEWSSMALPQETRVLGIWGLSSNDVYATDATNRLLKYNGSSWSIFEDFSGTILRTVWGTSASNIYTGGYATFSDDHMFHYEGSGWSVEEDVNSGLYAIWGSSASDVYAAGTAGYMVHYDGSTWRDMSRHYVSYTQMDGTASNDVYAVGEYGLIEHYDGADWNIENGTNIWTLNDVFGLTGTNIYAVGSAGTVLQYDGTTWTRLDPLADARDNFGIDGTAANDVYVVNCRDDIDSFDGGDIFQYDGADWTAVVEDALVCLRSIWAAGDGNIFAVGYNEDREGWYYWYNGAAWSNAELQPVTRAVSVSGSSTNNVIAVGDNGTAAIFDGDDWSAMNTGTSADIKSVIVFSATEAYAVDDNGLLLSYDGNANLTWEVKARVASRSITKVWGTSGADLFLVVNVDGSGNVGGKDLIMHYDGSAFTQIESIADKNLRSAWGLTGESVYFVGDFGVILHYEK